MDLFSVTCTTCKSRLKVRDEGAIGHILACPKCGGMVMVKAPEGWQPGTKTPTAVATTSTPAVTPRKPSRPADSAQATQVVELRDPEDTRSASHFDAVEDLLSDAPPQSKPAGDSAVGDPASSGRQRFVGKPIAEPPVAAKSMTAVAEKPALPPPVADEEIPDWQPERPRKYWMLLAGSIAGGIALTVAVVLAINALRAEPEQVAVVPTPPQNLPVPATGNPSTPTTTPMPQPSDPSVSPMPPTDPVDPMPPMNPPVADPMDPTPMPMPPADPATPMPMPTESETNPFERILAPEEDPLAPPPVAPSNNKPPVPVPEDAAATSPPEKPALPRPTPRAVDVAARMADPLPGIETDGTPLADFLQVMSDLSTIPITLEPDALPLVQVGPSTPVTLKLANSSVGAAITTAARQLKLEAIDVDGQLVVRLAEPDPPRTRSYPVKDLTGGDEGDAAELAELIQALIDPRSWGAAGEMTPSADALSIRQSSAAHAQIIVLLEKLRAARGLKLSATVLDPALFALASRSEQGKSKLQTPITLNFSQPTQLGRILKRLEEAGGVRILVDWRDVAAAGWNPDGEATLAVDKQPLSASLTALTGPMDLAWRIVDPGTIQIMRPETLETRCELEVYKVAELLKDDPAGETLVGLVRTQLGEDAFRDGGGPGEIRCDAAGQCLIASLPQPKQQQLEALLTSWRSKKE